MQNLKLLLADKELEINKLKEERETIIELYNALVIQWQERGKKIDELEERIAIQETEFKEKISELENELKAFKEDWT